MINNRFNVVYHLLYLVLIKFYLFLKQKIMNEENKQQEPTKKAWNIADVIGWLLFIQGFIMLQNGIIWVFTQDTTDKWFSRVSIGLICFGFSGIIFRLRK